MSHEHELSSGIQTGLGFYYFLAVLMNLGFAAYFHYTQKNRRQVLIWTIVAGVFLIHSLAYLFHAGWIIPRGFRAFADDIMNPISYFVLAVAGLIVFLRYRKALTEPAVAWGILNAGLLFSGWAMTDENFQKII